MSPTPAPAPARMLNQPLGGNAMPRFGGLASMMRLPVAASAAGLDAAFIGVPLDIGTSNRAGTGRPRPAPLHRLRAGRAGRWPQPFRLTGSPACSDMQRDSTT